MEKEKLRFYFRLAMVPLLLLSFAMLGVPFEGLVVLGAVFLVLVLLKGKMWRAADRTVERFLPFTKNWPDWTHKLIVAIVFIIFFMALKQVIYFALSLVGIDLTELILRAVEQGQNGNI
ncbi:MAG: hypothetical protein ABH854_04095 [Candidatus Diapherotrites archaeon]